MLKTMTDEQIDHWFKVADETTAEYGLFLKIIMEDLANPDTPQIIKDYLANLDAIVTEHRQHSSINKR